eukprot:scaffold459_cov78-Skeletonema_marinoi.AAC.8
MHCALPQQWRLQSRLVFHPVNNRTRVRLTLNMCAIGDASTTKSLLSTAFAGDRSSRGLQQSHPMKTHRLKCRRCGLSVMSSYVSEADSVSVRVYSVYGHGHI